MDKLNRKYLISNIDSLNQRILLGPVCNFPVKVLQFGEGNFLRAFADWMINVMNRQGLFKGNVVVLQGVAKGLEETINNQEGLYTVLLRGIDNASSKICKEIVTCVDKCINPYQRFDECLKYAASEELRVIISNTTEAGISYVPEDKLTDMPPSSFPAKLTVLLYRRYKTFGGDLSKGFIILPCELIDRNGDNLKSIIMQYCEDWGLEKQFIYWVENANHFLNTLVDRIVTGFPKDEIQNIYSELGYIDELVVAGELFHLWVIEGDIKLSEEIPLHKAGLNVIWTHNLALYRERKVRILNGAHTMTALAAYLKGLDTVGDCLKDKLTEKFILHGIYKEIIPTLSLTEKELQSYADSVLERFANPYVKHSLLSISLNSVSKFKTRVLPSLISYMNKFRSIPKVLAFSFAALIVFYRGTDIRDGCLIGNRNGIEYSIMDDMTVLRFFSNIWIEFGDCVQSAKSIAAKVLSNIEMWGEDLCKYHGLVEEVSEWLINILENGVEKAMNDLMEKVQ
jgi:tagaturonate reductase